MSVAVHPDQLAFDIEEAVAAVVEALSEWPVPRHRIAAGDGAARLLRELAEDALPAAAAFVIELELDALERRGGGIEE